jgi:hypothetical protein
VLSVPYRDPVIRHFIGVCFSGLSGRIVMEHVIEKKSSNPGEDDILIARCSQCGVAIHSGKELVMDEKQIICEGCYRLLVNPDSGEMHLYNGVFF